MGHMYLLTNTRSKFSLINGKITCPDCGGHSEDMISFDYRIIEKKDADISLSASFF
jgi:hypothetical protein